MSGAILVNLALGDYLAPAGRQGVVIMRYRLLGRHSGLRVSELALGILKRDQHWQMSNAEAKRLEPRFARAGKPARRETDQVPRRREHTSRAFYDKAAPLSFVTRGLDPTTFTHLGALVAARGN
jgi:hypothetical protein